MAIFIKIFGFSPQGGAVDQKGSRITTSDAGCATQGRMQPSCFSSALRPGQLMRYTTWPLVSWQIQVRQVPLRHEFAIVNPASSAACSSGSEAGASNVAPAGSTRAVKTSVDDSAGMARFGTRGIGLVAGISLVDLELNSAQRSVKAD
jgi:hypothetical protein